jgi:hypothetical protein
MANEPVEACVGSSSFAKARGAAMLSPCGDSLPHHAVLSVAAPLEDCLPVPPFLLVPGLGIVN